MGKYSSSRQNKLHTKSSTKKLYKELYDMLTEWFGLCYDEKNKSVFMNKLMVRKYKLIRKFLKAHFLHDADLKDYIKSLPNVWMLKSWRIEIILVACFILLTLTNKYFFKIYTGIPFPLRGSAKTDLINIFFSFFFGSAYFLLLYKRKYASDDLEYGLLEISNIVRKKI